MAGYICPFCNHSMSLTLSTHRNYTPCFDSSDSRATTPPKEMIYIDFYKCPTCNKISISLEGIGTDVKGISLPVYPKSLAKQFPDYVPQQIRQDYEEAFAISTISPISSHRKAYPRLVYISSRR